MSPRSESPLPGESAGQVSVVRLPDQWFVACLSSELRGLPIARTIQGVPLVLFRGSGGRPAALLDRCPHRNAPLSEGRMRGELLECRYHGWRLDGRGACREIPGLCGEPEGKGRSTPFFAAIEQDGFVWIHSTTDAEPRTKPFAFPHHGECGYAFVRKVFDVEGTLQAALENALDVPHTAFLHGGLFRTAKKETEIAVRVRRAADRVEAEFIGEPRPKGLGGRLLSPRSGVVIHFDRFILPSIAQVEYRLGESHLVITTAMTPVTSFRTRLYAVASFKLPVPAWLAKLLAVPLAARIVRQDAAILALQSANIHRFGGERFASTEIDVLGPHIWLLLKQAERGETPPPGPVVEHQVRMRV